MVVSNFANAVFEYSTGDQNDNAQLTKKLLYAFNKNKNLTSLFCNKKKTMIERLMTVSIVLLKFFLRFVLVMELPSQ